MNGFCMQKTDFPFVCCIVDDASTDGEQDIINNYLERNFELNDINYSYNTEKEYAKIIYARHKINLNCFFAVFLLKENHYSNPMLKGKQISYLADFRRNCIYEALCEGDDYWTCADKLQKQVKFLDTNEDYTICSHRILKYDQDTNIYYKDVFDKMFSLREGVTYINNSSVWLSETCSVIYRLSAEDEYNKYPYSTRDIIHVYYLLKKGKGMCLNDVMGVYRQHSGGVFSKQSIQAKMIDGSYKAMKELFSYEHTEDAKKLYYSSYAYTFILSRGRILLLEPFEPVKFFHLFILIPKMLIAVLQKRHPSYKPIIK